MPYYAYGRIAKLALSLNAAKIEPTTVQRIMEGGEAVVRATSPELKAEWLRGAMCRMDELLEPSVRQSVREACACCLGGQRLKVAKSVAKNHASLEDRVAAANESRVVGSVRLTEDGLVTATFSEGPGPHRCPCLPKAKGVLPITYCYCCGGHVKHHLQIALGRKMSVEVASSALSSGGSKPCVFVLTLEG